MTANPFGVDPIQLFGDYMKITGVPSLAPATGPDPRLAGKKLGVVNGSSWISLWSTYFGRLMLPGVKIVNAGNEAVQLNFMDAHEHHRPCPPQINIDLFCRYARDLFDLVKVDAILISCSTMNRAFAQVRARHEGSRRPRRPDRRGHDGRGGEHRRPDSRRCDPRPDGQEHPEPPAGDGRPARQVRRLSTASRSRRPSTCWARGGSMEHNDAHRRAIRHVQQERAHRHRRPRATLDVGLLVLRPDPVAGSAFPVLNSGQTGFRRAGEILAGKR